MSEGGDEALSPLLKGIFPKVGSLRKVEEEGREIPDDEGVRCRPEGGLKKGLIAVSCRSGGKQG